MKKNILFIIFALLLVITIIIVAVLISAKRNHSPAANQSVMELVPSGTGSETEPGPADDQETGKDDKVEFILPAEGVRPYAVMIDNEGTKCLPQGGLNLAQIIYEVIVEGGETRLMPVFWNVNPEMIGPVRSSRHYFLDYAMEHDAIYVHFGWSPMAINDISKFKINNINGLTDDGNVFWDLTKDKYNWQDSYTSMEKVEAYVKKVKYRTQTENKPIFMYNEADSMLEGGQKADGIKITYSHAYKCGFEYDEKSLSYNRTRKGEPQMERVTEEQLKTKNIIIQHVKNYTIEGDTEGRQEVVTVGSGSGWFITCGKAVKIEWSKASRDKATRYLDENGKAIVLNPGQTWIQVVPLSGKVEFE